MDILLCPGDHIDVSGMTSVSVFEMQRKTQQERRRNLPYWDTQVQGFDLGLEIHPMVHNMSGTHFSAGLHGLGSGCSCNNHGKLQDFPGDLDGSTSNSAPAIDLKQSDVCSKCNRVAIATMTLAQRMNGNSQ